MGRERVRCDTSLFRLLVDVVSSFMDSSVPSAWPSWTAKEVCTWRTTSETFGRSEGSWAQQRWLRSQRSSVKLGCSGRPGRFPDTIRAATAVGGKWPNGAAPVKT